jgi:hypothetical protein
VVVYPLFSFWDTIFARFYDTLYIVLVFVRGVIIDFGEVVFIDEVRDMLVVIFFWYDDDGFFFICLC